MAAIAAQAVRDLEEALKPRFKVENLKEIFKRQAKGRFRKGDLPLLSAWEEVDALSAVEFFNGGMWELVADVVGVDYVGIGHAFRKTLQQAEAKVRSIESFKTAIYNEGGDLQWKQ